MPTEPFAPAVDGHVDVADNLSTYLRKRAASQFERDRERKRAFDSPSDFEAHRETVRTTFLDGLGGLPDQPEDLAPETAGVLEQPGYTVEKVVFESRPGFHVTANCYVPHGEGPHPRVLVLPGHVGDAKAKPYNQRACIEFQSVCLVSL